ncbi:MAG: metal ABC transporter ATP-binding protein [Clostridia bacterium]|jgi:zinc transport system ATP-binding protein|nr:metal ABC transporter ATP-binding protein [Clostridia bacterium]
MKSDHSHPVIDPHCSLCRIELDKVGVTAGGETLISDISFHIHCGQLTALVGPNGAGKTTLIQALLGQRPHTGQIRHVDADGHDFPVPRIGYVPQQLPFDREMPLTVRDLMAASLARRPVWTGVSKKTRQQVVQALSETQAEALIDKRLGTLSGGELQRVLLAMALCPLPDLLVLDEPVSGVDQNGLSLFLQTVSALRKSHHLAILMVSHDWDLVRRYADTVILVRQKVLRAGTPAEVFSSPEFEETFRTSGNRGLERDVNAGALFRP